MPAKRDRNELEQAVASLELECGRLKAADRKFKSLFNASMDGLAVVESGNGRMICVNKQLCTMLGYSEESLVGKVFDTLLPPEIAQSKKDLLKDLHVCGGVFTLEFLHADGHLCVVDLTATLVPWDEDWAILCTLRNAGERVQLEKQLRQAQKMEAIGALAGGVAHDLNNILAGLVSYPDLLLMDLPEESRLRKPILTIKRSGERAAAIVEDLLTLSRRGVSQEEVISLNEIVSAYVRSPEYGRLWDYHPRIRVETRLAQDLHPVKGSRDRLSKVLANLILNAAEAMPQGGDVFVATENRHVDGSQNDDALPETGDYAVLMVSDAGAAITSTDLERIFEPFHTNKKMGRSGTGLGMTVVWRTVRDHNGCVDARSEAGLGTTVTVYLPAAQHGPKDRSKRIKK